MGAGFEGRKVLKGLLAHPVGPRLYQLLTQICGFFFADFPHEGIAYVQ